MMFCYLGYRKFCTICLVGLWRDFVYGCGLLWRLAIQRSSYVFTDFFFGSAIKFFVCVCVKLLSSIKWKYTYANITPPQKKASLGILLYISQLPQNFSFAQRKEITRNFVVSMNIKTGSTCFYSQLWDMRITRIE